MYRKIRIKAGDVEVSAELNTTKTARAIWEALPIEGNVKLWGDEVYFSIPVSLELDDALETVNEGDLGYWPQGTAFCIFFGPTPISSGDEIRPASPVNVFGKIIGDAKVLKQVRVGSKIMVEKETRV